VKRTRQTLMKLKRTRQTNEIIISVKQTSPCVCVRSFSDHPGRNDVVSGRSQAATPNSLSLRVKPRRNHQASEEDHTHTRFERRDAVSTTHFTPGSLEVVSVYLPPCELLEGGATTPGHQITGAQWRQSVTSQPENYLGVQQVPGQGVFHAYRDGSWIPTAVDGEVVHPLWGLTKTGKARK
jgi:hypothetical protein